MNPFMMLQNSPVWFAWTNTLFGEMMLNVVRREGIWLVWASCFEWLKFTETKNNCGISKVKLMMYLAALLL